jgi:CBS domain-containing protein
MTRDVKCVKANDAIQAAAQIMAQVNCGSVPVCDENSKVIGMVTDRDIVVQAVAKGSTNATIRDCMTGQVVTCRPETDAHEAADLMAQHQIRRLPVVDASGKLCGICSIGDLATVDIHINEAGDALSKISVPTSGPNAIH